MTPTSRQLNRATLERQLLLRREPLPVLDAVRRAVAIQAQEPVSPYVALWNRVERFDPADLDAAFADGSVVKASLMRLTLHAVAADDHPTFRDAMASSLRASRVFDRRFKALGLTPEDADEAITRIRAFLAEPRTNAEVDAELERHVGVLPAPGLWWALRTYGPWRHAPTGATWAFGPRPSYVATPEREPAEQRVAIRGLVERFLDGFGPASVLDVARFTLLKRPWIREAVADLDLVTTTGPDGAPLLDHRGATLPDPDVPAPPRLMAMWDSVLFAYAGTGRVVPEEYRAHVVRNNGDCLATVLVDGLVAGVWRPTDDGIEVTAFHRLPDDVWDALTGEARALHSFLRSREGVVHRRYERWWTALPAAEVVVLS